MDSLSWGARGNLGTLPDVRGLQYRCFSGQPSELGGSRECSTQKHLSVSNHLLYRTGGSFQCYSVSQESFGRKERGGGRKEERERERKTNQQRI